jgi:putative ABC transport system permease protein
MNLLDIKYTFRYLIRKKYYTLINILGLGIGLGCAMLMAIYLIHEFSFDKFHSKASELYRVVDGKKCETPYAMGEAFREDIPEIKNVFRVYSLDEIEIIQNDNPITEKNFFFADSSILSMLDFKIVCGNHKELLGQRNALIISEKIAQKYFPGQNPIGKIIKVRILSSDINYSVTGVFKNLPSYSSMQTGLIANIGYAFNLLLDINYALGFKKDEENFDFENNWKKNDFMTFVQIGPHTNINNIMQKCTKVCQQYRKDDANQHIFLQPYTDMYLHSEEFSSIQTFKVNQLKSLKIFMGIGLLILLVACINFILISNADTDSSVAEIACRKVNGASRLQIAYISLFKTCLVSFLSLIPALFFIKLVLPVFNNLFQNELSLTLLLKWQYLLAVLSITLITGILAGIYLGVYLSGVSPVKLFQNKGATGLSKGKLKGALVVIQFIAFILLVTSFLIMQKQYSFSLHKDLGLNTQNVIIINFNNEDVRKSASVIRDKLATDPNVLSCVLTSFMTPPTDNILNFNYNDHTTGKSGTEEAIVMGVGELELLQIPLLSGVTFNETNTKDGKNLILNEVAAKKFKLHVGDHFLSYKIIGITRNFHFHSLHSPIDPVLIVAQTFNFPNLLIKTNGNTSSVLKHLKGICNTISPGYTYDSEMLSDRIAEFYKKEEKQIGTIGFFSVIALALSVMGLMGFVSINLAKRTKEIGIRKINGARIREILYLFYLQYMRWLLLAFIIACPISWYAMHKWLQNFAYKTELSWWVFALAGIVAVAVAVLAVSWQSWRAATRNPVESLRYE